MARTGPNTPSLASYPRYHPPRPRGSFRRRYYRPAPTSSPTNMMYQVTQEEEEERRGRRTPPPAEARLVFSPENRMEEGAAN